ncbi:hypothetical protein SLE2022_132250 [Rubroshorea leprosula]
MADPISTVFCEQVADCLIDRILDFILKPITARITVVRKCNENVEKLKSEVEKLKDEKKRMENHMKDAGRRGEVIDDTVKPWLTNADDFIKAAEEPVRDGDEFAKKECFFRLCPNPIHRYKLSKKAEKNSQDIVQHLNKALGYGPLPFSHAPPPQQDEAPVVEGFEEFPSRMAVLSQIMEALRNPMVDRIGVHGISGVGKTMLVNMVKAKAKQDNWFTKVVMATVTKDRDLRSIQEDIARDLDMDLLPFRKLTDRQVADRIKAKLKDVKKFLVILDDVWETKIDLGGFGIPSPSELKQAMGKKNEESSSGQEDMLHKRATAVRMEKQGTRSWRPSEAKQYLRKKNEEGSSGQEDMLCKIETDFDESGIPSASELKQHAKKKNEGSSSGQEDMLCRILLTSRDRNVLSSWKGEKDQVFEVRNLEDGEAWRLFKRIVGSNVESSSFQATAKEIVENCLGLPVAIVSVGEAMKGKTEQFEWEDALQKMKKPSPKGIAKEVYNSIELNYNYLKEEELKQTFILCSLLAHDSSIDDLLKYGMGLDLFQTVNTIEQTRTRVQTLVRNLKLSALLVDGHSSWHFGMHDQIREVALSIAFRDCRGLALVDEVAREMLKDKKTLKKLKWISLPNGDIDLPANGLQCPQLTFFYLSNKAQSQKVPSEFFERADGLKVLCLTKIDFMSMSLQIPSVPVNLHSLLLDQCVFKVEGLRTIMENLENLEVFSLAGCDIEELPGEIQRLSKLKLLDVTDCTKLRLIPRQALASLSRSLEELKMGNSFDEWDVGEGNARLDELAELHKLTALEVCIPNFRAILFPENLRRFKIFLGEAWYSWDGSFESSKTMKLKLQGASIKSDDSVKKLLKKTEDLFLEGLNGVQVLVDELDDEGFQHLKCLHVQNAPDIRGIFNPAGRLLRSQVFPMLEVLTLSNLGKMEKICHGLTGAAPFKVLRKITVVGCHELKNLFSFSMSRQLQLQEITVRSCNNIEEIIDDVEEQGNGNDIVEESEGCKLGGSLRSLTLTNLPKLISFFNSGNCSGISLFNDKFRLPNLEELQLSGINVDMIWIASYCVENLTKLIIHGCDNLKYLFSSIVARSLVKLGHLEIRECKMMTKVLSKENEEEKGNLIFPGLKFLQLRQLQNLVSFYFGDSTIEFSSLNKLIVLGCPKLKGFAVMSTNTDVAVGIQPFFNEQDPELFLSV